MFAILCTWVLVQISVMSQERGSGRCILNQIQTCMFCPSIFLPLTMVEYPVAARQWLWEPTYTKCSPIYVRWPFKSNYVFKKGAFEHTLRSIVLLEGNLLKPGNPYCGLSTNRQPTNNQQPTNCPKRNWNTASIGHSGIDAPLTICWKCGKTWPP